MAKKDLRNFQSGVPADFSEETDPMSNIDEFDQFLTPGQDATEENKQEEQSLEDANMSQDLLNEDIDKSEAMMSPKPEINLQSFLDEHKISQQNLPNDRLQNLLNQYKKYQPQNIEEQLKQAQDQRKQQLGIASLLEASNIINQGLVGRYGGKAGDLSGFLNSLREQSQIPLSEISEKQKEYDNQRKSMSDELKIAQSISMQDPNSRVSDLYRKAARAKKLDVTDDMSASDIEKLLGLNKTSTNRYYPMTVMGEDGKPKQVMVNTANPSDVVDLGMQRAYSPKQIKDPRTGEFIEINPGSSFRKQITGPETATKKESGKQTVEVTRANLDSEQNKRLDDYRKQFMDDTKDDRTALGAAQGVRTMLAAGKELNGDILRAVQNQLARGSGEKGAMTENDVAPFGGRASLLDRLNRMTSIATVGQLPESDRKFLNGIANAMEKRARNYIDTRSKYFVNTFHDDLKATPNLKNTDFDKSQTRRLLGVDSIVSPANKIKVQKPDGSIGYIPEENIEKALKAGFKRVD